MSNNALEARAFLHARGLDVEPTALNAALRAALAAIEPAYHARPGHEGLTEAELEAVQAGGLDSTPQWNVDPLSQGIVASARIIKTALPTSKAAAILGVSDARVRQRLREGSLWAVRFGRSWRLPSFQFVADRELPGWNEVCRQIPRDASPVAVERWMTTPHPDLRTRDGASVSPSSWLVDGRSPQQVAELAAADLG